MKNENLIKNELNNKYIQMIHVRLSKKECPRTDYIVLPLKIRILKK